MEVMNYLLVLLDALENKDNKGHIDDLEVRNWLEDLADVLRRAINELNKKGM